MLTLVGAVLFLGPALVAARRGASFGVKLVVAGFGLCLAVLVLSAVASALTPLATRTSWAIETVQIVDMGLAFAWLFLGVLGVGAGAALGRLLRASAPAPTSQRQSSVVSSRSEAQLRSATDPPES